MKEYLEQIAAKGGQVSIRYFNEGFASRSRASYIRAVSIELFKDIASNDFSIAECPMRSGFFDDLEDGDLSRS